MEKYNDRRKTFTRLPVPSSILMVVTRLVRLCVMRFERFKRHFVAATLDEDYRRASRIGTGL
jgi:hypothetical protein